MVEVKYRVLMNEQRGCGDTTRANDPLLSRCILFATSRRPRSRMKRHKDHLMAANLLLFLPLSLFESLE